MRPNICLMTDSYKQTHWGMYPPGTTHVYSYLESRTDGQYNVFFGLQYYLKKYLCGKVVEPWMINQADNVCKAHFGRDFFNREGWEYILHHHGGHLPIRIKAVPEGTIVPTRNVLMTIENTDPKCYWLPNFLETILMKVWYPTTVATLSHRIKKNMMFHMNRTCDDLSTLDFKLHDFGYRGVSSEESAEIGGLSHLVNFSGTDTMIALLAAKKYYYGENNIGFSVPATEHSVMTALGPTGEVEQFKRVIEVGQGGVFSIVSDSYDIFSACRDILGVQLRGQIDAMPEGSVLVIRPDSGDPVYVLRQVFSILCDTFGYTENSKGFKVLNPRIRVIQGDGVNYNSIDEILNMMTQMKLSHDNITFGMGGKLLQDMNRDTYKFAFKCSAQKRNGVWEDVWKKPITDSGKDSKRGRLILTKQNGQFSTIESASEDSTKDCMDVVFHNGNMVVENDFSVVRQRSMKEL